MDGEDRGGRGFESRAGRGGAGSRTNATIGSRVPKSRDNVGRFIRAGACPRVPDGRGGTREAGVRTRTKRRRRAMAIGERALTARTAAPSRPAAPERRCARLRLEDDADHPEEVEAAPPRAVARATGRRADARGATGTEASPAVGRATVAALTDIFRVVWWDGLFVVDDARKGARTFVRGKTPRGDPCKTRARVDPAAFRSQKIKSWCPRESQICPRHVVTWGIIPTPVRRARKAAEAAGAPGNDEHRQRQRPRP